MEITRLLAHLQICLVRLNLLELLLAMKWLR